MLTNCGSGTCLLFMKSLTAPPPRPPWRVILYKPVSCWGSGSIIVIFLKETNRQKKQKKKPPPWKINRFVVMGSVCSRSPTSCPSAPCPSVCPLPARLPVCVSDSQVSPASSQGGGQAGGGEVGSPHCSLAPLRPQLSLGPLYTFGGVGANLSSPARPLPGGLPPPEASVPDLTPTCGPLPPLPLVVASACPPLCMVSWEKREMSSPPA